MKVETLYLHMGWAMNYPFSPRTWSAEEWQAWIKILGNSALKRLMVWPGFEFVDHSNENEIRTLQERCHTIVSCCHEHGLEVWLGRSVNTVLKDAKLPLDQRDVRNTTTVDVGDNAAFKNSVCDPLAKMIADLPPFEGWWCIDRDPGACHGRPASCFADALESMLEQCPGRPRPIYWMWGGWSDESNAPSGWRERAQTYWSDAHRACAEKFGAELLTLCCWPGHLHSLTTPNEHQLFPYHGLEPEPSIPFSAHPNEERYHFELSASDQPIVLNIQTPCLRTPNLIGTLENNNWDWHEPKQQELRKYWVWDENALTNTIKLWNHVRSELERPSFDQNALKAWIQFCGANFPSKRGRLHRELH